MSQLKEESRRELFQLGGGEGRGAITTENFKCDSLGTSRSSNVNMQNSDGLLLCYQLSHQTSLQSQEMKYLIFTL